MGIDAKSRKQVGHIVVQQVQNGKSVLLDKFLLHLVVHGSQGLCARFAGFGGEGVAQDSLAHFRVTAVNEGTVEIAAAGGITRFYEIKVEPSGVKKEDAPPWALAASMAADNASGSAAS